MKLFLVLLLIFLTPAVSHAAHGNGADDSLTAGSSANCNASFKDSCPITYAETTTSTAFAAPVGEWGSTTLEILTLGTMLSWLLKMRVAQRFRNSV
jgi:hypothetical protein